VFDKPNGAYTGEISVDQLKDSNITWTILGHSERRTVMCESDQKVTAKTAYAVEHGINVIWCCGESLEDREANKTMEVVEGQLSALAQKLKSWDRIVIAYEPIWAIGTGKVATTHQAQEAHAGIRAWLKKNISDKVAEETRILYGGSVTDKNCRDLSKEHDIDGFLVGGASLKPACESLTYPTFFDTPVRGCCLTSLQSSTSSMPSERYRERYTGFSFSRVASEKSERCRTTSSLDPAHRDERSKWGYTKCSQQSHTKTVHIVIQPDVNK
jgi:triosephosphate isomerase (TIM)